MEKTSTPHNRPSTPGNSTRLPAQGLPGVGAISFYRGNAQKKSRRKKEKRKLGVPQRQEKRAGERSILTSLWGDHQARAQTSNITTHDTGKPKNKPREKKKTSWKGTKTTTPAESDFLKRRTDHTIGTVWTLQQKPQLEKQERRIRTGLEGSQRGPATQGGKQSETIKHKTNEKGKKNLPCAGNRKKKKQGNTRRKKNKKTVKHAATRALTEGR